MNETGAYLLDALLALLLGLAAKFVLPYLKAKLTAERLSFIKRWVDSLVAAAEQNITGSSLGAERKAWVLSMLEKLEIEADEGTDALIEAAVNALNTAADKASAAAAAALQAELAQLKGGVSA